MATPSPPALEAFTSAVLSYRNGDWFNPPALTNFLGCLQAAPDLLAVQHLTFPPYSLGESWLGTLVLNDCKLHTTAGLIDFEWRPDRIVRRMAHDGYALESVTSMGVGRPTATLVLKLTNTTAGVRATRVRILAGDGVVRSDTSWKSPYSPRECPAISTTPWEGSPPPSSLVRNLQSPAPDGDGLLFTSQTSTACVLQVTDPAPARLERRWLEFDGTLAPGETREIRLFIALGPDAHAVLAERAAWLSCTTPPAAAAEEDWRAEIAAAFTPGNSRYSGHVPVLTTTNDALRTVYLNAVITIIVFKRLHAGGRTYTTLMPRYWVTTSFINDWSLVATLLVMLDPECVRRMIELWLERDIHRHFGTEYVSGESTGNWYSCNDYAMTRLITTYVRVTGETAWLETVIGDRTVLDHLLTCARHHRTLARDSGLADYGDRNSLLEAVGTYQHEVASLNAASVWILRETARLMEHLGDASGASALRAEADALVPLVQQLYVSGGGHWSCRQPDGTLVPVRHVWDFIHTINFLHDDLPPAQVREMICFFQRELQTTTWLAALSPLDDDTGFSLRPDHQWNGSYPAWVSLAATALVTAGRTDLLAAWLPGLAATARQGPYSQAHFVENFAPSLAGGARKAPTEWPFINDWTCLSGGNFFETVVLALFGLDFGYERLEARPRLAWIDGEASLHCVPWHGRLHKVTASGKIELLPP